MATVTIVSPTGNPEVWPEDKAAIKLTQGYRTFEDWQAEQAEIARQKHEEWVNDPDTVEERFQLLRQARDAKIATLDYMFLTDSATSDEKKAKYVAYRQALRDLPEQEGAPWDGGGELTPWPVLSE